MHVQVSLSAESKDEYDKYSAVFFIQDAGESLPALAKQTKTKCVFIFFQDNSRSQLYSSYAYDHRLTHFKIINLQTERSHFEKDIETILWFAFSQTQDVFLHIYHDARTQKSQPRKNAPSSHAQKPTSFVNFFTPKRVIVAGIIMLLLSPFLFVPPLIISSSLFARAGIHISEGNIDRAIQLESLATPYLQTSKYLFASSKPILHFLSLALPFEDVVQINESTGNLIRASKTLSEEGKILSEGVFLKNPTPLESSKILQAKTRVSTVLRETAPHISILVQKLPEWNAQLKRTKEQLIQLETATNSYLEFEPYLDTILGAGSEKKYLILFANNMELRPGGGFIGSFAIVKARDYSIRAIEVYDVYDADGQLTDRIEPPAAISTFLEQPFWYLRDSAFSADHLNNAQVAERFLELEMGETNFDGTILITTTAIKYLLTSLESLYIPDYKETITAENFYLKAQLYAEEGFFPGSQEKKRFLASVANQLLLSLPSHSSPRLLQSIVDGLDQKQIAVAMKDQNVQMLLEQKYWAGRVLENVCAVPNSIPCVTDYVMSLDANVGVNKANFFIEKPTELDVQISAEGEITNTVKIEYKNNSFEGVFPGGIYKNYVQLLMPVNALIQSVLVDNLPVETYDETNFGQKLIGFLLSVPPQESKKVTIKYKLPTTIIQGNGMYQLILQKQIGSPHANITFSFDTAPNIKVTRHNLSPLAPDKKIIYNTSISSDKLFLIEFTKI